MWMRRTEESSRGGMWACVCVCVCVCQVSVSAGTHAFEFMYFAWFMYLCWVCESMAPHHRDTGLSGSSYSPFSTLLSQQVAPNVLFSPRIISSLSFYSSVLIFFFLSLSLSHSFFSPVSSCFVSSVFHQSFSLSHVARCPLTSVSWAGKGQL